MAKCKLCKMNIPDGTEYCKSCQDKEALMSNESYLDSLLNSVKNTVPSVEGVYKKKNSSDINSQEHFFNNKEEAETKDDEIYTVDVGDIEDFDQFNLNDDLRDLDSDFVISDKELFGEDLSDFLGDASIDTENQNSQEVYADNDAVNTLNETSEAFSELLDDSSIEEVSMGNEDNSTNTMEANPLESSGNNINQSEITDFYDDEDSDQELNELLNSIDGLHLDDSDDEDVDPIENAQFSIPEELNRDTDSLTNEDVNINKNVNSNTDETNNDVASLLDDGIKPIDNDEMEQVDAEDDDFLSLLNQISSDDPVVKDVRAINDILNGGVAEPSQKPEKPSDVGEVFSDALKVVSSLNDHDLDELDSLGPTPEKKKKSKKSKKSKEEESPKETDEKPKKGLLKRLFGNVEDEKAKQKKQTNNKNSTDSGEEKKKGKSKNKKGASTVEAQADEILENAKPGDGKAAKEKAANKKDKKEKKKKTKEVIQVIDEIEEDEGRINRLGACIVFVFFGLLVLLLIAGTKAISYTISIQNATKYFSYQKYTEAYEEVYGEEIKDEDMELYSKIQTVMFVNKQLNSYNNYYSIGEYPEALDSLLKGLKRYNKYIEFATILGIESDLNYVRKQILAELDNEFGLSEEEAIRLIETENMKEYSLEVYEVASEKMNKEN